MSRDGKEAPAGKGGDQQIKKKRGKFKRDPTWQDGGGDRGEASQRPLAVRSGSWGVDPTGSKEWAGTLAQIVSQLGRRRRQGSGRFKRFAARWRPALIVPLPRR